MLTGKHIALLLLLASIWGASFLFSGIAVQEIAPLHLVFLRVAIAAPFMMTLMLYKGTQAPLIWSYWWPFLVMGLLNNVIPFTAIFYAQTEISVSLTGIVISTTPIFTFIILALARVESLAPNKILGALIGTLGVVILLDPLRMQLDGTSVGIGLNALAAMSYGFAALWAKKRLTAVSPVEAASMQIIASTLILTPVLLFTLDQLPNTIPSAPTVLSILALALLSTAIGYLIFFKLVTETGPSNAVLVTLLVPVSATLLGWLVMGDQLTGIQILGALSIASALLIIDGRLPRGFIAWVRK